MEDVVAAALTAQPFALQLVGLFAVVALVLAGLLYHVSVTDPLTFAAVALLLACGGLAACLVPACRAPRLDPIAILRHE